jgi:hypothetical protein
MHTSACACVVSVCIVSVCVCVYCECVHFVCVCEREKEKERAPINHFEGAQQTCINSKNKARNHQ